VLIKVNVDGSVGYHSIGFGDPNSTSGYLIPSIEIPQYKDGVSMESGAYFGEIKFTGGHEQTIVAVNNGDIDGRVSWGDTLGFQPVTHDTYISIVEARKAKIGG